VGEGDAPLPLPLSLRLPLLPKRSIMLEGLLVRRGGKTAFKNWGEAKRKGGATALPSFCIGVCVKLVKKKTGEKKSFLLCTYHLIKA
jgi:hypothetical protein